MTNKYSLRVRLPKNHRPTRPDIGGPFAEMLFDLRDVANKSKMNRWSYTVTCRRIIAEAWMRKTGKSLSPEAAAMLKPYYADLDFDVQAG